MEIKASQVKALRDETGAPLMDCKRALKESEGNLESAKEKLRISGIAAAEKKSGRATLQGIVGQYLHHNNMLGAMVTLRCETDFVARTDQFQQFSKKLAMQIAASNPLAVDRDRIPKEKKETEEKILKEQLADSKKPPQIIDKIMQGKMEKFYQTYCLMDQEFFVEGLEKPRTVRDAVKDLAAKLGENIQVGSFVRLDLSEEQKN